MTTQSERLAALEQRLGDHESRCEERLTEIKATSASTLAAVEGLKGRVWAIVIALLAWALAQLWAASEARVSRLEAEAPAGVLAAYAP
ncbi:hypothetical protein [Phenylobacterium sp.]|uniref:hypothetical protein n=1 Tax=Phenylobacterium sp. TaxID=1871053 RepID=UPI00378484A3